MRGSDVATTLIELGFDADKSHEAARNNETLDTALDWLEGNEERRLTTSEVTTKMESMAISGKPVPTDLDLQSSFSKGKHDKGSSHGKNDPMNSYPSDQIPTSFTSNKGQSSTQSGKANRAELYTPHHLLRSKSKYMSGRDIAVLSSSTVSQDDTSPRGAKLFFKRMIRDKEAMETHMQRKQDSADEVMQSRWGPPGGPTYEMIMRYWNNTHMKPHWIDLFENNPNDFKRMVKNGYCEPIPTAWVVSRKLAYPYPEGSYYETPAEKRLYYFLNHGQMPGVGKHPPLRPLNINRDISAIIRRGNERNARARPLDPAKLQAYASPGDIFQSDKQIKSHQYSPQVDNVVYEARTKALHELADAIIHGTDHLETMILVDVSGSMSWNPHGGITGPDGVTRYHDQPSNISLVEHLIHRVLQHMVPRAQKEHPKQLGIDTVTFSSRGTYVGQLTAHDFKRDWSRVRLGGGTQVMSGWQVVKNTYFEHQHAKYGHGRYDKVFGWQPTPGMPKLSLLIFLDGECQDMDEFELELLGETWAYVTVALVGMEGCPHHHSHAIELERVAKFNPHVGFFDVHGRVCERMCVEDLLKSVYPVDPPAYEEILRPEFDLPAEQLPPYS